MLHENLDLYPPGAFARTWTVYSDAGNSAPQDLTGWTARAQVRSDVRPLGALLGEFTTVLSGSTVTITATAVQLAGWLTAWPRLDGPWDLVLTASDGSTYPPLVSGRATLHPNVTY